MPDLLAVTGRAAGIRYRLEDTTTVGRSSDCTIQLLDDAVSRQHVVFRRIEHGFSVEDLASANGSTINGGPLDAARPLTPGDTVGVGATTFVYEPSLDYLLAPGGADVIVHDHTETVAARYGDVQVAGDEMDDASSRAAAALLATLATSLGEQKSVDVVQRALAAMATTFGADRAFVLTRALGQRARVRASLGEGPITISRTVLERVFAEGRAIVSGNAVEDVTLEGGVSLVAADIRSLLAAPLLSKGRVVGVLHFDQRKAGAYGPADLRALVPLANVMALVLLAADGLRAAGRAVRHTNRIEAPEIVAASPAMKRVVDEAVRAARSNATVLVSGPTGSGKEVVARLVHTSSDRRDGPFVAVNCGALVQTLEESALFGHEKGAFTGADQQTIGLFEAADGGTLFLDEVQDTSRGTQVKLLRALQERVIYRVGGNRAVEVDVRIVAATSRRLDEAVAAGDFREDLFYRLGVVRIEIPPLAARPEDIPPLAERFAREISRSGGIPERTIDSETLALLVRHTWPGNVRELANTIERAVILSDDVVLRPADLPLDVFTEGDVAADATVRADTLAEAVGRLERGMILRAIARTGAVKTAVADALGISRVTLDAKLKAHHIPWPKKTRC